MGLFTSHCVNLSYFLAVFAGGSLAALTTDVAVVAAPPGGTAQFHCNVTTNATLESLSWQQNGVERYYWNGTHYFLGAWAGRASSDLQNTYHMTNVTSLVTSDEGNYTCVAVDSDGATENATVALKLEPDACTSQPCKNGANCTVTPTGYSCICLGCFDGSNCENETLGPCNSSPCKNGATCTNSATCDAFTCSCDFNFEGTLCNSKCSLIINETIGPTSAVLLGDSAAFSCDASATKLNFYKSGSRTKFARTFNISKVKMADAGVYYCEAELGKCVDRAAVTVDVYYVIEPNTTITEKKNTKPGKDVELSCTASGQPEPLLHWVFLPSVKNTTENSTDTDNNTAMSVGNSPKENSTTLTINDLMREDAGTYTCIATLDDDVTVEVKVVTLIVEDPGGLKWWHYVLIVAFVIILIVVVVILIIYLKGKGKLTCCKSGTVTPENTAVLKQKGPKQYEQPRNKHLPRQKPNYEEDTYNGYDSPPPYHQSETVIQVSPQDSRPLPSPPGGRANALEPLDVQAEKKKIKKHKKKIDKDGAQSAVGTEVSGDIFVTESGHMTEQ